MALWVAFTYLRLPHAEALATQNPESTALIEARAEEALAEGKAPRRRQNWVSLRAIARSAVDAVVLAEDAAFYQHEGVDTQELRKAVEESWEKGSLGRGASTITQQLAKNLWLSNDRSLLRKGKELILARRLESALSKERILTLYLNVVEWGNGVYGIGAAAREHFGVHPSALSPAQSAILAAMLPSPRKRLPRLKGARLYRYASTILARMEAVGRLDRERALKARQELSAFFGKALPEKPTAQEEAEAEAEENSEAVPGAPTPEPTPEPSVEPDPPEAPPAPEAEPATENEVLPQQDSPSDAALE